MKGLIAQCQLSHTCVYCELRYWDSQTVYTDTADTVGLDTAYGFPNLSAVRTLARRASFRKREGIDHRHRTSRPWFPLTRLRH